MVTAGLPAAGIHPCALILLDPPHLAIGEMIEMTRDPIERRYVVRQVKQRLHQVQFRGAVLPAYGDRCTVCRLRELALLDAAHISNVEQSHNFTEAVVGFLTQR